MNLENFMMLLVLFGKLKNVYLLFGTSALLACFLERNAWLSFYSTLN